VAKAVLPTGTITFLFTDIEGSTRHLQILGPAWKEVVEQHDRILREAFHSHQGVEVSTEGDAFFVAFTTASAALSAAIQAQRALAAAPWPGEPVRVRMGMHTGEGVLGGDNYVGIDVHRAARIASAAHGGQVLVSAATKALLGDSLATEFTLRDLGEHRLKDLSHPERLYQLVGEGLAERFPPPRGLSGSPNNLPVQLTSFIGREGMVATIMDHIGRHRLVTLTGPGGTGKTRLALQVAAGCLDSFSDGVFFVPLAAITEPEVVMPTVAANLGLPPIFGSAVERIGDYLSGKSFLLVLDNLEQVVAVAPDVAELLALAPTIRVLTTSRAPLRVSGEQEVPVPTLPVPVVSSRGDLKEIADLDSVAIFIERAMAARPDFRLTEANAEAVAEIVTRVDGLPLAIELAAARVKLFSPEAMVRRLGDRLALLTGGARDLPSRQQTLRGAIAWSYDLLDSDQRTVFERLSVFAGGGYLDQIIPVVQEGLGVEPLEAISHLVDHSLIANLEGRFTMLETIREYASERLAERGASAVRAQHAEVYAQLAEEASPHLTRTEQKKWLDRLEGDHDNLRAGLEWAIESGNADLACRMGGALWRFWQLRGYVTEAVARLDRVLALSGSTPALRSRALEAAGGLAYWQARPADAHHHYAEALAIEEEIGDTSRIANAAYNLAFPVGLIEGSGKGLAHALRALDLYRQVGDRHGMATAEWGLGTINMLGESSVANMGLRLVDAGTPGILAGKSHYDTALEIFSGLDDAFMLGWTYRMLGFLEERLGHLEAAREHIGAALRIFAPVPDITGVILLLRDLAQLAVTAGQDHRAVTLVGAMSALEKRSGTSLVASDMYPNQIDGLSAVIDRLDPAEVEKLFANGRSMSMAAAIDYALQ
jgi:predicted ATPase/class 3 adenylate cyclase